MDSKKKHYMNMIVQVCLMALAIFVISVGVMVLMIGALFATILAFAWNTLGGCVLAAIFIGPSLYWLLK